MKINTNMVEILLAKSKMSKSNLAISAGIYRSVQGGMQMMIAWILCGAGGMLGGMVS